MWQTIYSNAPTFSMYVIAEKYRKKAKTATPFAFTGREYKK